MQRRQFCKTFLALSISQMGGRAFSQESCRLPELAYPDFPSRVDFNIEQPGAYCLDKDYRQHILSGAGHTGPRGFMVTIFCGSVSLDLKSFTLGSSFGTAGISLSARNNLRFAKNYPSRYGTTSLDSRFVSVRNGTIDLAHGEQTSTAIEFIDEWWASYGAQELTRKRPRRYTGNYIRNEYLLENLKIHAYDTCATLEGSHSVIRNCVLESNGAAAIFIAGPNVTIENCEIRLRASKRDYNRKGEQRAAIILRDGTGAVIRNNTIRIDYGGEVDVPTYCILVKDGAKDVLIEGNTFINVKGEPVTLQDEAQATVRENRSEQRWLPF